jgi:hypothetical protein
MSKQQLQPIDFSKYEKAGESKPTSNTSSNLESIDFSQYETAPKKKAVTASSGQEDSGGFLSNISDFFATATPTHSGLGAAPTATNLVKQTGSMWAGIFDQPEDLTKMSAEDKLDYQKKLKQRAVIDDVVTSSLLNSSVQGRGLSFLADKTGTSATLESLMSGGMGMIAAPAANILGSAIEFFQNVGGRLADAASKGQLDNASQFGLSTGQTGYVSDYKTKSFESAGKPLYELGQQLQTVSNAFMRDAKVEKGIAYEDVDKTFTQLMAEGKISDAFTTLGLSSIQQMPQIALLASTGGTAGAVFAGAGSMGYGASIGEEYAKDADISGKDALVSIAKGAIEGLTETVFRGDITALNSLKNLIKSEGREAAREAIIRGYGGVVKKALAGAGEEGIEEVIAEVGDYIVDVAAGNKQFNPTELNKLVQRSTDSFILGASSGGFISGGAAYAAQTDLTAEQQRSISRYQEVVQNEGFSPEIREAALNKIKDIRDFNAGKTYDNYRLISDIEDVNKRAEVIRNLNDIKSEEASQKELHDEELIAASNAIIAEKKAAVDKIMQENIDSIYSRSSASVKEQQKLSREKAANYLAENNYYLGFTENNADLLDNIQTGELVDVNDVNKAASSLYELEASVIADDQLTNQERNYVLQDVYSKLDSLESYDKITKNGKLLTENEAEPNRTNNAALRAEKSKKVRNNRFDGELFKFQTEDGRNISLRASVDENGDVTMAPIRKSFNYKTEEGAKANEPFKIKGTLEVGEIKRNEDGKLLSATITDTKGKKTFNTNNEELVSYLQAVQARQSIVKASNEGYSVDEDIESVQGNEILGKLTPNQKARFVNYYKALRSFSPDAQIILYDNEKKMVKGLIAQGFSAKKARAAAKGSMGLHHSGVVHVNIAVADDATVPHEIFHEAVKFIAKSNPSEIITMANGLRSMLSPAQKTYLDNFSNLYKENGEVAVAEEFLAELVGVLTAKRLSFSKVNADGERIVVEVDFALNRSIGQKLILGLREMVKKYAAKTKNNLLMELADKVGQTTNKTEDQAKFLESFAKSLREGTEANMDYIKQFTPESVAEESNVINQKIASGQTYDEGIAIPFPSEIDYAPLNEVNEKRIGDYDFPKTIPMLETVSHPIMSLNDVVEKYNGRVVIITSDATGYGVDSKGEPIFGGFGFSLNAKNVEDGIGFASVDVKTVKATYTSAFNNYGAGKVAVLIMIQNPSTAINNAYGTKYLFRGLSEVANTNEEDLIKSKEAIAEYIMSGKGDGETKVPLTPAKRKEISDILGKVTPNMTDKQLAKLQQEYIDATTFKTRKAIGIGIMSDKIETGTNKGTTYSKIALNKLGFSMFNFLKEYGDNTILTDDLISQDKGGYVVGGFELDVLPEGEERDNNINELQSKGIVHDMFNAKLAGINHFTLDGLYDVNENFARFAKLDTELDTDKLSKSEQNQLVRDTYKEDKYYKETALSKAASERTYSDLKVPYKIKFKAEVLAPKGLLRQVGGNIATKVASGQGFAPTEEGKAQIAKANYKMMPVSEKEIQAEIDEKVTDGSENKVELISQKRILYHGSPWRFSQFNNAKIGTGEGAQAYGWGIYLSEDFDVAQAYAMSNQGNKLNRLDYLDFMGKDLRQKAYNILQNPSTKLADWKKFLEANKGFLGLSISKANREKLYNAFGERNHYTAYVTGQNVSDGVWFDWHRSGPYNQQAALRALAGLESMYRAMRFQTYKDQYTKDTFDAIDYILNKYKGGGQAFQFLSQKGEYMYESIQYYLAEKPFASKSKDFLGTAQQMTSWLLQQAGIDGMRVPTYYAQGGRQDGLMNYVVFDANAIKIAKTRTIKASVNVDKAALMGIDMLSSARASMDARQNDSFLKWFNKDFLRSEYLNLYKQWFERNVNIKKELEKAQMVYAMQMMYNKAGASQFAQLKFGKYRKEIYGGLDKNGVKIVDSVTQLRRVIAIDENFDNQRNVLLEQADAINQQIEQANGIISNPTSTQEEISDARQSIPNLKNELAKLVRKAKTKERPQHGKHNDVNDKNKKIVSNKETAEATLAKLEEKIGKEAYAEYNKRADAYFKAFSDLLKYKLDNGLITEATYEMFKNYDYQPRNFLRFSYGQLYEDANGNMVKETPLQSNSFVSRGSMLNSDELKKINDGDMDYLDADSARLLQSALVTAEIRVATNKALKALAEDSKLANYGFIKEAEYERYKDGTIKLDSDGTPKFITPTDNRFINMVYKVDGKKYAFQLKNTEETPLADEFNDIEMRDLKSDKYKFYSKWLGAGLMKTFATGINVAFPITNIPIDVISQIHLTDIYEGTIAERYQQAMMGTLEMAKRLTAAEFKLGDTFEINDLIYEFAETGGLMMSLTREYSPQMEGNWAKVVDGLGTFGNISELASKLNAYQTVKDRLMDQYYKENGFEAREEDLDKIKTEAAYKSRAAMDYHRGGTSAKWLDGFAPYFNVMMQVSKISASYIANNKVEFGKKIGAAGLFVMAVTMYNMMVSGDDYDNDDVHRDIINNLVIFNSYKNEDGTRGYTKVAVPPTVKWFLNRFQHMAEGVYLKEVLQDPKRIERWQERTSIWKESSDMFAPRFGSVMPPVVKGMVEYGFNYDIWRGKQIVEQVKNRETSPYLEGVRNKNVAEFWKVIAATDLGKGIGLSPAKAQKAADDIFPLTNPLISMGYSLMDKSVNQFTEVPESYRSKFNKDNAWTSVPSAIGNAVVDRFQGTTDPTKRLANPEYAKIKTEEADKLFILHDQIHSMVDNGASLREIRTYAKTQGREYVEGVQNYAMNLMKKDKIQYKIYEQDYFAMAFAPDARAKAGIMIEFEKTNKIPNMELYRKDLRRFGILNANVQGVYEQLKREESRPTGVQTSENE